jgi:hypothetical protein
MPPDHVRIGREHIGLPVRVDHKFGGIGNKARISRGELKQIDWKKMQGLVHPHKHRSGGHTKPEWVPLGYLNVDKSLAHRLGMAVPDAVTQAAVKATPKIQGGVTPKGTGAHAPFPDNTPPDSALRRPAQAAQDPLPELTPTRYVLLDGGNGRLWGGPERGFVTDLTDAAEFTEWRRASSSRTKLANPVGKWWKDVTPTGLLVKTRDEAEDLLTAPGAFKEKSKTHGELEDEQIAKQKPAPDPYPNGDGADDAQIREWNADEFEEEEAPAKAPPPATAPTMTMQEAGMAIAEAAEAIQKADEAVRRLEGELADAVASREAARSKMREARRALDALLPA